MIKSKNTKAKAARPGKAVKVSTPAIGPRIKVQLDHKTTMVVHSMAAFKMWKKRYPLAKVIA